MSTHTAYGGPGIGSVEQAQTELEAAVNQALAALNVDTTQPTVEYLPPQYGEFKVVGHFIWRLVAVIRYYIETSPGEVTAAR